MNRKNVGLPGPLVVVYRRDVAFAGRFGRGRREGFLRRAKDVSHLSRRRIALWDTILPPGSFLPLRELHDDGAKHPSHRSR